MGRLINRKKKKNYNNSTALRVNYSAYTLVATPQDIDQMTYFKAIVRFLYFNAIVSRIISSAPHLTPPLLIPKRHFKP